MFWTVPHVIFAFILQLGPLLSIQPRARYLDKNTEFGMWIYGPQRMINNNTFLQSCQKLSLTNTHGMVSQEIITGILFSWSIEENVRKCFDHHLAFPLAPPLGENVDLETK